MLGNWVLGWSTELGTRVQVLRLVLGWSPGGWVQGWAWGQVLGVVGVRYSGGVLGRVPPQLYLAWELQCLP